MDEGKKVNEKNDIKIYKRETLLKLPETEKKLLNFQESKILENKFGINKIKEFDTVNLSHLYFFHYKCESVNDTNWGCAWRSMQSLLKYQLSLSNQNKDNEISFYNLFMKYGSKDKLIEIFIKMKEGQNIEEKTLNVLLDKKFAPFETDSGWAEPFISQLVLYDFGFEGELLLINNYSNNNYAPKEVFSRTLNFNEFKEELKIHFKQDNPGPIIIDDSYSSLSIIGVKFDEENNNIELIIMDPHAVKYPEIGLYIIILNDIGEFVGIIPNEFVLCSRSVKFSDNKPWMAYIPKVN
jgi:hypothetical protein